MTSSCRSKSHSSIPGLRIATDATGLVSVMPHPWSTLMPRLRQYQSIIERGTADPPHRNFSIDDVSTSGWAVRYCWIPSHTVGTPADMVTCSSPKMRTRPSGLRSGPG